MEFSKILIKILQFSIYLPGKLRREKKELRSFKVFDFAVGYKLKNKIFIIKKFTVCTKKTILIEISRRGRRR